MALVSGIVNFYNQTNFLGSDMDASINAIVAQVGGTGLVSGSDAVYPGNLDSTNFASGMALPNSMKLEPNSLITWNVFDSQSGTYIYLFVEQSALITHLSFSYRSYTAGTPVVSGNLSVAINQAPAVLLPIPAELLATKVHTWGLNWQVKDGDIIEINQSYAVSAGALSDPQFTFYGKALHR